MKPNWIVYTNVLFIFLLFIQFAIWPTAGVLNQTGTSNISINNTTPANTTNSSYASDRVIVKYRNNVISALGSVEPVSESVNSAIGANIIKNDTELGISGLQVVELSGNKSVSDAISQYEQNPLIEYAEPDYIVHIIDPEPLNTNNLSISVQEASSGDNSVSSSIIPNDTFFYRLYGMHNTGQAFYGSLSGTADDDVDAPEAWSYSTGSSNVIVAVVDTGVQTDHPDLSGNVLPGYNFITDTAGQTDDNGHGTHCAGTIGAIGNNGKGVAGVCWNVTILPCKFLDSSGYGYTSDAIEAINYAKGQGASIISNSWGGGSYSSSLKNAIENSGALVVCAAGNDGVNTDYDPQYPSCYDSSNIVSVAATDWNDNLAYFSNYGSTTVDVAAPGDYIYSTLKGSTYSFKSGTSMATPMVSGIAALMKSANSSLTVSQMKNTIMNTVDARSSLTGTCITGGRVNAYQAVKSVYTPLQARFFGIPGTVVNPLSIQFHDASTGDPTGWLWNFGDGNSSTSQNPSHTYYTPGNFTVQLTVNNSRE